MSMNIAVKIDPADSAAKVDRVTAALHKVEDKAERTKQMFERVERAFAAAVKSEQIALLGQASRAFDALARAIEMEARALEQATGRARDFGFQLAALQKLHDQGRISTEQYIRALEKLNAMPKTSIGGGGNPIAAQQAQTQQAMNTIGFGSAKPSSIQQVPTVGGFSLGTLAGAGGAVGAGIGALSFAHDKIEEWKQQTKDMEDRMTVLANTATKFTGAGRDVNAVIDQQIALGGKLHATGSETIKVYDAIEGATKKWNFTASEQLRLTESVGKAAQLGGDSMQGAANIVERLSIAFELGLDRGTALTGVFRKFPDLAEQLERSLGLTSKQIIEMADSGRLGFVEIARGLTTNTEQLDRDHARLRRTHAQTKAIFTEGFERMTASGESFITATFHGADLANGKIKETKTTLQAVDEVLQVLKRSADEALRDKLAEGAKEAAKRTAELMRAAMQMAEVQNGGFNAEESASKAATEFYREREAAADRARQKAQALAEEYQKLGRALLGPGVKPESHRAGITAAEERSISEDNAKRAVEADVEAKNRAVKNAEEAMLARIKAEEEWQKAVIKATDEAAQKRLEFAEKEREAADKIQEAWMQGLGSVAAEFVNMAAEGEISFDKIGQSLAKLALQIAAMQIGGPWGALLGSFAGGLSFGMGGEGTIPRAANGLSGVIGGAGGTDTSLFMARVTPGEHFEFRTPAQQQRHEREMAPVYSPQTVIEVKNDPREISRAMGSRSGKREFAMLNREFNRRR